MYAAHTLQPPNEKPPPVSRRGFRNRTRYGSDQTE